jgi:hypothetical protein
MSSVVGTDVPAAALLIAALALLVTLGPRRPWAGAIGFGVVAGLCAWVRAVALPLTMLALGYWIAVRVPFRRALAYTAAGVGATLLVLLPWGIRHLRQSGELYFTDDHGGITALIGANPNSEGTYTRALNQLFKDVAGRGVLDQPHRQTDRAAYDIAREWTRFEPGYALGLAAKKADRLFDPEHRLMYWSVLRPGVLVGRQAAYVAAHRQGIIALADGFGLAIAVLGLAGIALAVLSRRWPLLSLLPFQLSLAATYVMFFAEPRYRIPIEMLAFPFVALALGQLAGVVRLLARRDWGALRPPALRTGGALLIAVVLLALWPVALDAGASLRAGHRWAVTEALVDARPRTLMWRIEGPRPRQSLLSGAPNGVHLTMGSLPTELRIQLGGGPLPPGTYLMRVRLEHEGGGAATVAIAGKETAVSGKSAIEVESRIEHPGGRLSTKGLLGGVPGAGVWASDATVTTLR